MRAEPEEVIVKRGFINFNCPQSALELAMTAVGYRQAPHTVEDLKYEARDVS